MYCKTPAQHYNLENQYAGYPYFKQCFLRFMMKHMHPQKRSRTSSKQCQEEQGFFRNPPPALPCPPLVFSVNKKGDEIHNHYDNK